MFTYAGAVTHTRRVVTLAEPNHPNRLLETVKSMSVAGAQLPGTQHNSAVQQISSPSTVVAAAAAAASVKPHPTDLAHLAAGSPDHPEPSNALASAAEAEAAATDAEDAAAEAAEAAEADCHSISPQMQFYRTSYKLSQQQVTLPRGIYSLPPRANLPVQLYVAVHPQDWNCDQYVADRAASLAVLNPQVGLQDQPTGTV